MNRERFESCLKSLGASWNTPIPDAVNLVDDSREIHIGDIFVLRQGASPLTQAQAQNFSEKAVSAGAAAIIADSENAPQVSVPVIALPQPHLHLGELAEGFYGIPSSEMKIIAVTGTNGKTTTTYLIESLAIEMGLKVGVIGTISYRYPGYEEPAPNTTPGTLRLYRLMRAMADAGCDLVAMEVSSHGIMQGRIDGVQFDAAIWNNLGTDHLDFHKTREAYALAKQRLFDHYLPLSFKAGKTPAAIPNACDDEVISHVKAAHPENWGGRVISFSSGSQSASIAFQNLKWQNGAWQIDIQAEAGIYCHTSLPLIGAYNVANAAGALSALFSLGYQIPQLADALSRIKQIPERMECVGNKPTIIVDFAHTPEALENALLAARECVPKDGRLISVFGAGGDRDPSKRPMMGSIATKLSDFCFVTSDNPRTENPDTIIDQILCGIDDKSRCRAIADRKLAIRDAILSASDNDVVIVAGKGHEDYQIIGTQKFHFDDREICRECLKSL